jgi:hypothetical protein
MAKPKISLSINLGIYLAQNHQDTALVQPLGRLTTYVWTTYYQTAGFTSEAISLGPPAAEQEGPGSKNWDARRQHDEEQL